MSAVRPLAPPAGGPAPADLLEMRTIVRRVVASRVRDAHLVDPTS